MSPFSTLSCKLLKGATSPLPAALVAMSTASSRDPDLNLTAAFNISSIIVSGVLLTVSSPKTFVTCFLNASMLVAILFSETPAIASANRTPRQDRSGA